MIVNRSTTSEQPGLPPFVMAATSLIVLTALSCSNVEFELSPYAARGVDIVYSEQEDITFFAWRVSDVVDFDRAEFELYIDGDYQLLDLDEAPFPSPPYECDRNYYCLQYQVPGQWSGSGPQPPIRTIDDLHGTFYSTKPRTYEIETTFDADPMPIDNNEYVYPQLKDWFSEQEIPLERSFQWALIPAQTDQNHDCPTTAADDWSTLVRWVDVPHDWRSDTPCFAIRPRRHDRAGAQIRYPLHPGPMLYGEEVETTVPEIEHPTLVAFVIDLEVVSDQRCTRIINAIEDKVLDTLNEEEVRYRELGRFLPIEADGTEHSGCDQMAGPRYAIDDLLVQADAESAGFEEKTTLVVVYLNNLNLPPSDSKIADLELLFVDQEPDDSPQHYLWSIGSNTINGLFAWDETTPWSPLEADNFLPSVESSVEYNLPLRSTDFDGDDTIALAAPNAADSPEFFRVCSFSPRPEFVGLPPSAPVPYLADTWAWSQEEEPELYFDIVPQEFVADNAFAETRVTGFYEVCDENCDRRFLGADSNVYPSWYDERGVCRWH